MHLWRAKRPGYATQRAACLRALPSIGTDQSKDATRGQHIELGDECPRSPNAQPAIARCSSIVLLFVGSTAVAFVEFGPASSAANNQLRRATHLSIQLYLAGKYSNTIVDQQAPRGTNVSGKLTASQSTKSHRFRARSRSSSTPGTSRRRDCNKCPITFPMLVAPLELEPERPQPTTCTRSS